MASASFYDYCEQNTKCVIIIIIQISPPQVGTRLWYFPVGTQKLSARLKCKT